MRDADEVTHTHLTANHVIKWGAVIGQSDDSWSCDGATDKGFADVGDDSRGQRSRSNSRSRNYILLPLHRNQGEGRRFRAQAKAKANITGIPYKDNEIVTTQIITFLKLEWPL